MRQELILILSSNDKDAVISIDDSEEPKVEITMLICCSTSPSTTPFKQDYLL